MLHVELNNQSQSLKFVHSQGPLEFGRGAGTGAVKRCVVYDKYFSKDHVRIEEISGSQVRVTNLSQRVHISLSDDATIDIGACRDLALPAQLRAGSTSIDLRSNGSAADSDASHHLTPVPVNVSGPSPPLNSVPQSLSPQTLTRWFETVIAVQRSAAGSREFYDRTARAVVELVGLDQGFLLLRKGDDWEVAAEHGAVDTEGGRFSHTILRQVVEQRRTLFQSFDERATEQSLVNIEAVVASPVFDKHDEITAAVYGSRTLHGGRCELTIDPLEAQLVQVLAAAVGAGLARLEEAAEANRSRVQFEQFFTPELARELERNPHLLDGQERELTVLFLDVRGFSTLAERLSPHDLYRLTGDVMDRITARIRGRRGVVVDYAGDGVLAMWNAPADQPDHASLACRAALDILRDLPDINRDWGELVGGPLEFGIGLNTGRALVGNAGTSYKFKYGPRGHTVNLGSRVEGATKQLGIPVLVSGSTRAQLAAEFATRRLCKVRVAGIADAVDLYELHSDAASAEWITWRDEYEHALQLFESGEWASACRVAYQLLSPHAGRYDIPSLSLVARAVECLKTPPVQFDPVVELSAK